MHFTQPIRMPASCPRKVCCVVRVGALMLALGPLAPVGAQDTASRAADCSLMRERARGIPDVLALPNGTAPRLRSWQGVGAQAPALDRNKTVRFELRVDEKGEPIEASMKFVGLSDFSLEQQIRRSARAARFHPATIDGCDVEGAYHTTLRILPSGGVAAPRLDLPARAVAVKADSVAPRPSKPLALLGPECAAQRDRARGGKLHRGNAADFYAPGVRNMHLPPMPVPRSLRGSVARFSVLIDSAGNAVDSTAKLTGIADKGYTKKYLQALRRNTYRPALFEGCQVESWYVLTHNMM